MATIVDRDPASTRDTGSEPDRPPTPDAQLPPVPTTLGGYDGPTTTADRKTEAELMATSRCALHPLYRRDPGSCFALLYRAQALRIPVGIAVDHIYINTAIGRSGLSAQLMAALLHRAGITWREARCDDQAVTLLFQRTIRRDGRPLSRPIRVGQPVTWSIREAVAAGLTKRRHWQTWPTDCLWARALARASRRYFSDIVMGMGYLPEEVYDMGFADAAPDDPTQVDPDVQELLDQATSESATPELIREDILPRAGRLRKAVLPDGRTLEQALAHIWEIKTNRQAAARADDAITLDDHDQPPAPVVLDAPAGTGSLDCGCPAATILSGDGHLANCRGTHVRG